MPPPQAAAASELPASATLTHIAATHQPVPLPPAEAGLPTATAQFWMAVPGQTLPALEGPVYDRAGNLLFVDVYGDRILRVTPEGRLGDFAVLPGVRPAGLAVHRDGRVFVAGIGDLQRGSIVALQPDGSGPQTIVPASAGHVVDDLVFDRDGGIYFTDFCGAVTQPTGGVFYLPPGGERPVAVIPAMAAANGVALSPDGRLLWATEFCAGRLHRVALQDAVTPMHFGTSTPYHFTGRAPDSMRVDAEGNVYVAMYDQGRVLVFNPCGIPVGQILLPGRAQGHFLKSTSLAFLPGTADIVITARDEHGQGAALFRARGLAPGARLFSHL